ncbi:hypothetical protein H7X46_19190 [Pseudonocardia sp. C8]|uniref:hypothetical protein n=1 Tax=Pseudonocardia sp. C8 TaxID=2762759 RepID=UPI0016428BB7|nr:hypothetical protein [Pseudonocardia sp. C8]MBC3193188.1 hypothetical protein [Pseudonocardia sp. C8]
MATGPAPTPISAAPAGPARVRPDSRPGGAVDAVGALVDAVFDEEFAAVVAASGPWPPGCGRPVRLRPRARVRVGAPTDRPDPPSGARGHRTAGAPAGAARHRFRPAQRSPPAG